MDNLIKKYENDYSPWLGRPWKQQRGGGCFTLIYDYMKDTGIQTFSKDYSMFVREYKIEDIEAEGWGVIFKKDEGEWDGIDWYKSILKKNDVVCFSFGIADGLSNNLIKHAGVYLGDGLILQHKYSYVSNIEYLESYIPMIRYILRKNE